MNDSGNQYLKMSVKESTIYLQQQDIKRTVFFIKAVKYGTCIFMLPG